MRDRFYMVFVEGAAMPRAFHDSFREATDEAGRLTVKTGKTAYVLRPCARVDAEKRYTITNIFPS